MMRREKQRVMVVTFLLTMLASAVSVLAQEGPPPPTPAPPPKGEGDVVIFERHIGPPPPMGEGTRIEMLPPGGPEPGETFIFLSTEMSFGRKVVKNAPYSAQAITETVQTLADGNRIVRKNTANIYRDSEGRIRHDQSLSSIGPWAAEGEARQTSFINDPVAHVNYVLDPRSRIARRIILPPPPDRPEGPPPPPGTRARERQPGDVFTIQLPPPGTGTRETRDLPPQRPKVESLGKRSIEGIEAEGTRDTFTIPAGELGNEQPMQIVSERWYSPELQTIVLSRHSDPRMGETTFRLTNITRNEPAHSLFEVPSDYTIKEGPGLQRIIRKKPGEER
jgi:hypothetical protein